LPAALLGYRLAQLAYGDGATRPTEEPHAYLRRHPLKKLTHLLQLGKASSQVAANTPPNRARAEIAELPEYLTIISALIKPTDPLADRYSLFDVECRAVLEGVRDEEALLVRVAHRLPAGFRSPSALPSSN
jgi:hypothetical protein